MKWIVMLLLGMLVGALGAVSVVGAMKQDTPLRKGVMAVSSHQFRDLRGQVEAGRCDAATVERRLRVMRGVAADFEPAFLPTGRDDLFRRHQAGYVAALEAALATPPSTCASLGEAVKPIGLACRTCHDDFR